MTTELDAVLAQALKLTPDERAELIVALTDTMLPAPPLHPDWEAEIARRVAEMDAESVPGIPAAQVMAELQAMIEAHGRGT